MNRLIAFVIALTVLLTSTSAVAQPDRLGCSDLDDYQDDLIGLLSDDDAATAAELWGEDVSKMRPSQLLELSGMMDRWATDIEDMPITDVPLAAREYHEAFINLLSVGSSVFQSLASGGPLAAMAYMDAMEQTSLDIEAANTLGVARCGDDWPFEDEQEGEAYEA